MKRLLFAFSGVGLALLSTTAGVFAADQPAPSAKETTQSRSLSEWMEVARKETKAQQHWDQAHPQECALRREVTMWASQFAGKPEKVFPAWWREKGAAGFEQWVKDGFPLIFDDEHMIYLVVALYGTQSTEQKVFGIPFQQPAKVKEYYDAAGKDGEQLMLKGFAGDAKFTQDEYNRLRRYGMYTYCLQGWWGRKPFKMLESVRTQHGLQTKVELVPGDTAPDFTLPRMEAAFKSPAYSDAYTLDYQRLFHSEAAMEILQLMDGYYEPKPGDHTDIQPKPYQFPYPDPVSPLAAARGKKPVLLLLQDQADGDCATITDKLEPLYWATKDRMDWYIISETMHDFGWPAPNYFKPYAGMQTYVHPISFEERAQRAKTFCMTRPDMGIPILLDDMAKHHQNAYFSDGGSSQIYVVDKNGVVAFNNGTRHLWDSQMSLLFPNSTARDDYHTRVYISFPWQLGNLEANVIALLDNDGVWNGKPATITNWDRHPYLQKVKISKADEQAKTITVVGVDGKEVPIMVDARTRIIRAGGPPNWFPIKLAANALTVGTDLEVVTFDEDAAGRSARIVLLGTDLCDGITDRGASLCTPAIVTTANVSVINAKLVPRPKAEMLGLNFWEQAGDKAEDVFVGDGVVAAKWKVATLKDWLAHPDKTLTFHVDRGTEVFVNGMKGSLADIRPGDFISADIRPGETPDDYWPYYIRVYRFKK